MLALLLVMSALPAAQSARSEFERGVIALHHFEYEEANEAFVRAQKADPGLAMAYWGEAMTYHQTLWRNEDLSAGRQALTRLASTPSARAAAVAVPRDRALIDAVAVLFGEGDSATRRSRYAGEMARAHAAHPEDPDVASLYALALLGTMSRSLIGYVDPHEGHSASLAGSDTQTRVAGLLETILRSHPQHPGALHYLLHNYDDPTHARLALQPARTYATVAPPSSSHALHMPAHIFVQLGMWSDAAMSDRAAFKGSDQWVKAKGHPSTMRSYHALSWLQYELLQLGRYREAWEAMGELEPVVKASGDLVLLSDLSSMRARFVVETRRWEVLANVRDFGNVNELYAIGVSAARAGNTPLAQLARQQLGTRSLSEQEGDMRPAVAIMERQVAAVIELVAGRSQQAVEILQAAAQAELKLPAPLGLPAPIKPATELLGEVLLEVGRPREAIEAFGQALARNANRTLSVVGLARASAAAGLPEAAHEQYRKLLATLEGADADVPEVAEAKAALDRGAGPFSARPGLIPVMAGLLALVAAAFGVRRLVTVRSTAASAAGPRAKRRRRP